MQHYRRRLPRLLQHRGRYRRRDSRGRVRAGVSAAARGDHRRRRAAPREAEGRHAMSADSTFNGIQESVGPWISGSRVTGENRLDMETTSESLLPAVTALSGLKWGYLSAITGFDS